MKAKIEDVLAYLIATLLMGAVFSIPTTLAVVISSGFSWYDQIQLHRLLPMEGGLTFVNVLQVWGEIALVFTIVFISVNSLWRRRSVRADRNVRLNGRR